MPDTSAENNKNWKEVFGNRLRVRVCGIAADGESLLLVKHIGLGPAGVLWAPPGGGMAYGESVHDCLRREFLEETGLHIQTEELLFVNEHMDAPLHSIELFFSIKVLSGQLTLGGDPEMNTENQIIKEVRYVPFTEIAGWNPLVLHAAFRDCRTIADIWAKSGFMCH